MPGKKSPVALVLASPAARTPGMRRAAKALDVPLAVVQAVRETERLLGGREGLIAALSTADTVPEVANILWIIADSRNDKLSLATVCAQNHITPGELFRALKEAALVRGQVLGLVELSNKAQQVAKEVALAATEHTTTCPRCTGLTTIVPEPTLKGKPSAPIPCPACGGKGEVLVPASLDHQKLVFESIGILKKAGGVNVQTNILNPSAPSSGGMLGGSLEQLQQAVGELLFGRSAPPASSAPVEGTVLPAPPPPPEDPPT
jgi:hypothetical protein